MHIQDIFPAHIVPDLPYSFEKREAFDISDSAADFDDHNIVIIAHRLDGLFYFIGYVRDNLDGLSKVISASLFCDDIVVDLARGIIVCLCVLIDVNLS